MENSSMNYEVRITRASDIGRQRAIASITINGVFVVRGIRIMEGKNGLFVSMPRFRTGEEYKDYCYPCTAEEREKLNSAVMAAYEKALEQLRGTDSVPFAQTQSI